MRLRKVGSNVNVNPNLVSANASTDRLSIDFWDTLVIREQSGREVRESILAKVAQDISVGAGILMDDFESVAAGLRSLAMELGFDAEYRLKPALFYTLCLHTDAEFAVAKAEEAYQDEIRHAIQHSRLNFDLLRKIESGQWAGVTVVSDFEADKNYLQAVLDGHQCPVRMQVYTSSDYLLTKQSGRLIAKLRDFEDYRPRLHIGDSVVADRLPFEEVGIRSILVQNPPASIAGSAASSVSTDSSVTRSLSPLTYKQEIRVFGGLARAFADFVAEWIPSDSCVAFVGSEGAFFSQILHSSAFGSRSFCMNFGRRALLERVAINDPIWAAVKLVQQKVPISELAAVLSLRRENVSTALTEFLHGPDGFKVALDGGRELGPADLRDLSLGFDQSKPIYLIDLGYKGTSGAALRKLGFNVHGLYLLGYQAMHDKDQAMIFLDMNYPDVGLIERNTALWETLFSIGPRSSGVSRLLKRARRQIQRRAEFPRDPRASLVKQLAQVSGFPSRRMHLAFLGAWDSDDAVNLRRPIQITNRSKRFATWIFSNRVAFYMSRIHKYLSSRDYS